MSIAQTASQHNALAGIGWMVLTGLMFVCVTAIVRYLGSDMPAIEAAFIRYAIGLALVIPVLFRLRPRMPRGSKMALYAARGLVHGGGVMLWFFAMARIPIAEVTAIRCVEMPEPGDDPGEALWVITTGNSRPIIQSAIVKLRLLDADKEELASARTRVVLSRGTADKEYKIKMKKISGGAWERSGTRMTAPWSSQDRRAISARGRRER